MPRSMLRGVAAIGVGPRLLLLEAKLMIWNVSPGERRRSARVMAVVACSSGRPFMEPEVSSTKMSS